MICLQPLSKSTLDCFRGGSYFAWIVKHFCIYFARKWKKLAHSSIPPPHTHTHTDTPCACIYYHLSQFSSVLIGYVVCIQNDWKDVVVGLLIMGPCLPSKVLTRHFIWSFSLIVTVPNFPLCVLSSLLISFVSSVFCYFVPFL